MVGSQEHSLNRSFRLIWVSEVILALICFNGCDKGNPIAPIEDSPRYFPLAKGNTWIYDQTNYNPGQETTFAYTVALDSPLTYDGVKWYGANDVCVDCIKLDPMSPTPLFCAAFARDGNKVLTRRNGPGPSLLETEVILDFPLNVGKVWTIFSADTMYTELNGDSVHYQRVSKRFVRSVESVTVPAGAIGKCFHIEDSTRYLYYVKHPDGSSNTNFFWTHAQEWFAADIGLVRQIVDYRDESNGNISTSSYKHELRSYQVRLSDKP